MWLMAEPDSSSSVRMAAPTQKYPWRPVFCSCGPMKPHLPTGSMRPQRSSINKCPRLHAEIDRRDAVIRDMPAVNYDHNTAERRNVEAVFHYEEVLTHSRASARPDDAGDTGARTR